MSQRESRVSDENAQLVEAFSVEMANLGFERMTEHLLAMLDSGAWLKWKDGLGEVDLLPGEFDYFLSMCGVTRETVMHGIRDVEVKARLQQAMDERRSGDSEYRRSYNDVTAAVGKRRGTQPFGYSGSEAKALAEAGVIEKPTRREALGATVRRFVATGSTKPQSKERTRLERVQASVSRLSDEEFAEFDDWLEQHREERRRGLV